MLRGSGAHGQALRQALTEVHGVGDLDAAYVSYAGRTDGAIARDLLLFGGIEAASIDAGVLAVRETTIRQYAEICPPDLSACVSPGILELLDELAGMPERFRLSLLTGNYEQVARLKLDRAGIGAYFTPGQGAFGSDHEDREQLPAVARARAGAADGEAPWPRERTLIIGDTPRDIAAARADRIRCISVATGPFGIDELGDADHVARDGHEVAAILRTLE